MKNGGGCAKAAARNFREGRRGFTLLELMVTAGILVVSLLALLATYISLAALIESSRNTTVAINDANRVIEQMRNSAATSFTSMVSTNWTGWASSNGANTLTDEQVGFCYYNLNGTLIFCSNGSTSANPVQVNINVSWTERSRARSEQVVTLITNRQ